MEFYEIFVLDAVPEVFIVTFFFREDGRNPMAQII